jgi:hypothetical protein
MYPAVCYVKEKGFSLAENLGPWKIPTPYNRLILTWKYALSSAQAPLLLTVLKPLTTKYIREYRMDVITKVMYYGLWYNFFENTAEASSFTANVFLSKYCIDRMEKNSQSQQSNGIVLRIKGNSSMDGGALLPTHNTFFNLFPLSRKYCIYSHEISQKNVQTELDQVITKVSKNGPIKILTIEAHGCMESITLNTGDMGSLHIDENPAYLHKVFKKLDKDCVIILQSCSTGEGRYNIADYICSASQRTVFAPSETIIGYPKIIYQENESNEPEHAKYSVYYTRAKLMPCNKYDILLIPSKKYIYQNTIAGRIYKALFG